jgi:hypothetical protein
LHKHDEAAAAAKFPATCPYTIEQVLTLGWYPEPPPEGETAER